MLVMSFQKHIGMNPHSLGPGRYAYLPFPVLMSVRLLSIAIRFCLLFLKLDHGETVEPTPLETVYHEAYSPKQCTADFYFGNIIAILGGV